MAKKTTQKPKRETPVSKSKRIDVYLPLGVWRKLRKQATEKKRGVAREAAEILAGSVGSDAV